MQDAYRDLIASFPEAFMADCRVTMGLGWLGLLREVALRYAEKGLKIQEVYSKLGSMRVHPICSEVLEDLELYSRSMATCEDCGQPGRTRDIRGYCRATCDVHEVEWTAYMIKMYR